MYTLVSTPAFERAAARFLRRHPDLRGRLAAMLLDLQADPFQPHLRLHALSGRLQGTHAIAITHAYRVIIALDRSNRRITLLRIGSHDAVYR
jgi:mRNA-degrading endonuclease YafQ of YafQ-DinJ toxin-antitoxin module